MSTDRLFRWNFSLELHCEKCTGFEFVEEVSTKEIFCATCGILRLMYGLMEIGNILARDSLEWPQNWDEGASFGSISAEPSRTQSSRLSAAKVTLDPINEERQTVPASSTGETIQKETPTWINAGEVSKFFDSAPVQANNRAEPHQIGTTPLRSYDVDLLRQSQMLELPADVVVAAKKIMLQKDCSPPTLKPNLKAHSPLAIRAALFTACRQLGRPKTFNEFEEDLDVKEKSQFRKHFRAIETALKTIALKSHVNGSSDGSGQSTGSPSPTLLFPQVCTVVDFIHCEAASMNLSDIIRNRAIGIAQTSEIDHLFHGRRPSSTAAIILSFAAECEECYVGSAIYAEAANVGVNTILSGQKMMLKLVEDMAAKGPLPKLFCARWSFRDFRPQRE